MTGLFVTATGTDLGKTYLSAALVRHLRRAGRPVEVLKPVMSGFDPAAPEASDAGRLLAALGRAVTPSALDAVAPLRFSAPLAPNMAARREGRRLMLAEILEVCRSARARTGAPLIVEGVGGIMSPVAEDATCLDWVAALGCPSLLVAGTYLGAISHALTAVAALASRGLALTAVVANETRGSTVPLGETCAEMRRFLPGVPVLACPQGAQADDPLFAELARLCGL